MNGWFAKARSFIRETREEMSKCTWPTKDQLLESTILVMVAFVITAVYVAGLDQILLAVIRFVITF